ncbi:MAG TPA: DUF2325 domain-containing protein, partial [Methylocystis sp.]|nr:DUF2325 domain-containing protein [Methylocystis sp.]
AVDNGFVPGAYWALITHARLPSAVEARIYGDVHMMSHICGASHRSDARALAEARREKADVARRLTAIISGRNEDLRRQQTEIERLTKQVMRLEPLAAENERVRRLMESDERQARLAEVADEVAKLREENEALRRRCAKAELRREHLEARMETLKSLGKGPARPTPDYRAEESCETAPEHSDVPHDLCGRCLLYVGGRPRTVCRLQQLVARQNGSLLHHDGGLEHNRATLGELIKRADAVFFPVDCVSHGAADAVKSLCESYGIPYAPLRSAGATAFTQAVRQIELQTTSARHCS